MAMPAWLMKNCYILKENCKKRHFFQIYVEIISIFGIIKKNEILCVFLQGKLQVNRRLSFDKKHFSYYKL